MEESESDENLGEEVGEVFDFFAKPSVAAIKVSEEISIGNKIRIKGHTTDFTQPIKSMQVDGSSVESVSQGDSVGIKVKNRVRKHDKVYLVE